MLTYSADGRLKKETTGASGKSVEWLYDAQGRRQTLKSQFSSTTTAPDVTYGYNSYSQLSSAASSVTSVALSWSPNVLRPSLKNYAVSSVLLDQYSSFNTNGEMTQAYSYSNYYAGGFTVDDTTFTRNALGQITLRSTPAEGQRWNYQYDSRGQASKAYKTFISTPQQVAAGTQAQYTYDQIGNRPQWMEGGTSTLDSGLRIHTYGSGAAGGSANALNQYSTITQPQSFDVTGTRATGTTTIGVTAGTNPPSTVTYQQDAGTGLYFRADVAHNAASNTRYSPVNVTANSSTIDSWLQYVPPAAESLAYDADGNLTSDGRWTYKWDGENRLIRMDSVAQSNPSVKSMRLSFTYDGLSRRIRKDVYQDSPAHTTPPPTNGTLTRSEHYVYEGWNMILTAVDNGVGTAGSNTGGNINKRVASYIWGPDIGSKPYGRSAWQAAGGVGGLLIVTDGVDSSITYAGVDYNGAAAGNGTATADPTNDHYVPLIDHLGNITAYYSGVGGSLTLQGSLEYDAFGRETRSTGPACDKVPFYFSSKFTDTETGLNYYGYRFYDPGNGRWLGRDPIGKRGGLNLYGMVGNTLVIDIDFLGQQTAMGEVPDGIGGPPTPPGPGLSDQFNGRNVEMAHWDVEGDGCCSP